MKKVYNRSLWAILLIISVHSTYGQDPLFTQYYSNPFSVNPAFAGSKNVIRTGIDSRFLWVSSVEKVNSYSFSCDLPLKDFGVGLSAASNRLGPAYVFNNVNAAISYKFKILNQVLLIPAVEFSYLNRNMNWSQLTFYDQYSPTVGLVSPNSQATQPYSNINVLDVSGGLLAHFPLEFGRVEPSWGNLGLAVFHIPEKDFSHLGLSESIYPRRYVVHGGVLIPMFERDSAFLHHRRSFMFYPNFIYQSQGQFGSFEIGSVAYYSPFFLGLSWRTSKKIISWSNSNQLVFQLGFEGVVAKYIGYQLSYSTDWAFSGIRSKKGSHFLTQEISLIIHFSAPQKSDCIEGLSSNNKRWFDNERTQRRIKGECPPNKRPRKLAASTKPMFYPFDLPRF